MQVAALIHNPGAGDKEHGKKMLTELVEQQGYRCLYASSEKKHWADAIPGADLVVVAGGDGTVRRVALEMLEQRKYRPKPIALLPLGTANNIASSLCIGGDLEAIAASWKQAGAKPFDAGTISGIKKFHTMIECLGFGLFPNLVKAMRKHDKRLDDKPEDRMAKALEVLARITEKYKARECSIEVDGRDHSGKFLLVEVMNTRSMGPNLRLDPNADMSDGQFELVLVTEQDRERFAAYLRDTIRNAEARFDLAPLRGSEIKLSWQGRIVHIDDEIAKPGKPVELQVRVRPGALTFLV